MGALAAGTYSSRDFQPAITYRVPEGWGNFEDLEGNLLLIPPGGKLSGIDPGTSDFVGVYSRIQAEDARCRGPQAGVGQTPEAIAKWIRAQRDLEVTTPRQVSVGGLQGFVLDVRLVKGFKPFTDVGFDMKGRCLIMGVRPSGFENGPGPGMAIRLYLLRQRAPIRDWTLAIEVVDVSGGRHLDAYSSVVQSFSFDS